MDPMMIVRPSLPVMSSAMQPLALLQTTLARKGMSSRLMRKSLCMHLRNHIFLPVKNKENTEWPISRSVLGANVVLLGGLVTDSTVDCIKKPPPYLLCTSTSRSSKLKATQRLSHV